MKIMLASDLHIEHRNGLMGVIPQTAMFQQPDVIVLAGDIDSVSGLYNTLYEICDLFVGTMVLYVTGNHEYYSHRHDVGGINCQIIDIEERLVNDGFKFKFLNNESFTYGGVHFYGGCMWSPLNDNDPTYPDADATMINVSGMNPIGVCDYRIMWQEFKVGLDNHLEKFESMDTVVISHFSPSREFDNHFVSDGGAMTDYFCAPMDDYINSDIKAWFYGHNHYSDYKEMDSGCIVASCQMGYPMEGSMVLDKAPFSIIEV